MQPRRLTLGHSPDPDDAFMFYGLARGLIPTPGYEFAHTLQDIQTLNDRARRGELDVTAISIHAYAYVSDQYALLPSGASMGDGYGPLLVARQSLSLQEVGSRRIAVPGTLTSAFLALQLWLNQRAEQIRYVVLPFDRICEAVQQGQADVGLIIHEGQLTYQNQGLTPCVDLGAWWGQEHGGWPLPLGGNVIHKRIPAEERTRIARWLAESIRYSLEHREAAVDYALQFAREMGRDLADRFVGMYVNHWTLDYGDRGRASIRAFLGEAYERRLIPSLPDLEFVAA
jgi:1,4-dihydroxy-6-naphthoate synthase